MTNLCEGTFNMNRRARRARRVLLVLTVTLALGSGSVGAQHLHWVEQFGTALKSAANDVATDASGNVYLAGQSGCEIQALDPACQAYVRKYDGAGQLLWSDEFGSPDWDEAASVAVADDGSVYLAGSTRGALPGQTQVGYYDSFLRKYTAAGELVWTRQFGSTDLDMTQAVAVGKDAGSTFIYTAGVTWSYPHYDVCKFDPAGNVLWCRDVNGSFGGGSTGVAGDDDGNVYVVGNAPVCHQPESTTCGSWIRRYDRDGTELWFREFGPVPQPGYAPNSSAQDVAVDAAGDVYMVGNTHGPLEGQLWIGGVDAYLRKYDANGNEILTDQFGGTGSDIAYGVALDAAGSIYVAGTLSGAEVRSSLRTYLADFTLVSQSEFLDMAFPSAVALDTAGSLFVSGEAYAALPGFLQQGDSDAFVTKLSDVPPIAVDPVVVTPSPVPVGTVADASALFTDLDPVGTHSAAVSWGDASLTPGTVSEAGGVGSVSGSHVYTAAGLYTLELTVTDDDGGSALGLSSSDLLPVFDPAAGFSGGTGTLSSPAGAYPADPGLTGPAAFDFSCKYQGGNVPTGTLSFDFAAAGLSLQATAFDWLVVSGGTAWFQGDGLLGGVQPCRFLVAVTDGKVQGGLDRFRIQIWDDAGILYDTQPGDPAQADPTGLLDSGNVTVK